MPPPGGDAVCSGLGRNAACGGALGKRPAVREGLEQIHPPRKNRKGGSLSAAREENVKDGWLAGSLHRLGGEWEVGADGEGQGGSLAQLPSIPGPRTSTQLEARRPVRPDPHCFPCLLRPVHVHRPHPLRCHSPCSPPPMPCGPLGAGCAPQSRGAAVRQQPTVPSPSTGPGGELHGLCTAPGGVFAGCRRSMRCLRGREGRRAEPGPCGGTGRGSGPGVCAWWRLRDCGGCRGDGDAGSYALRRHGRDRNHRLMGPISSVQRASH